jgi:hypothetical protein
MQQTVKIAAERYQKVSLFRKSLTGKSIKKSGSLSFLRVLPVFSALMFTLRPGLAQELINVDVVSGNGAGALYYSGPAVLGQANDVWNPLPDGVTSLTGLTNSAGVPTAVGMTCSDPGSWSDPVGNISSSYNLLADYRFTGSGTISVTLTGLDKNATYNLVAYGTGNDQGQGGTFSGAVTGTTDPQTRASFVLNGNYVQNPVVAPDSTGTLSFDLSGNVIQCFNGLQIQKIPPAIHLPTITTQPVGQFARAGWTVNFSVVVDSGSQIPSYQWYLGAAPIAGATNSSLTLPSVNASNAGGYTVVVSNLTGSVTSAPPAMLTLDSTTTTSVFIGGDPGQGLDLAGADFEVAEYFSATDFGALAIQNATFTNNVAGTDAPNLSSGNVAPNFGVDQNDANLAEIANNWAEAANANDPIHFSVPTVNGESYKLQLIFHDGYNTGSGRRQLSVQVGSETLESALDVAGLGGGGSNPQGVVLSYYFTGNGSPLPITITNSQTSGYPALNALTLQHISTLPQVPYFSLAPQNQSGVQQGGSATFSALAGGSVPPFSYQWYFGTNAISGANNPVLSVLNVQPTNAGQYTIVASNSAGSVTNTATLAVNNNISIALSSGPAPGQGMVLQGNFVLAEYYNGGTGPNLPVGAALFVPSTRAGANGFNDNLPNFGNNQDELDLAQISYQSVSGNPLSFDIDTTSGVSYRLQLILHEGYFNTSGSRIINVDAISDSGSGVTTVLAQNLDLAALGAKTTAPTNVVLVYYFTGDGSPLEINMTATANAACISALTLEDLTDVVAPTMVAPLSTITTYAGSSLQYVAHVNGTLPLTYQWAKEVGGSYINIPGATNYILNLTNLGVADFTSYKVTAVNAEGSATSIGSVQNVEGANSKLIGHWLIGAQSFAETSGYMPSGTHDGIPTGTNYYWTNDVPPNQSGYSLAFPANNPDTVILITNTWDTLSADPGYQPTFDNVTNAFSVALWARGFPGTWAPWMSKFGETSPTNAGWQLRQHGGDEIACLTVRGAATAGDLEAGVNTDDGKWHFYVGTYDAQQGLQSIYVDGVLSEQAAISGPWTAPSYEPLIICGKSNGDGTSGSMATFGDEITSAAVYDIRIYNYALGPLDIAQLESAVTASPKLSISRAGAGPGSSLVLSWPQGVLLQSTNLLGPWITNTSSSPYTSTATAPQMFFKIQSP